MTKYLYATLVALVSSIAMAGTFVVPPNATVTGNSDGTVTWTGVALSTVVHYRNVDSPPVEEHVSGNSGSIKLVDVAGYGGRLQLRDPNGNYAWLTPEGVRFNLVGMHLECSNPNGCALEIDGTGPKSAPAAYTYPGGVYAGQAPTQVVVSTNQSVGVNTTQMAVAPVGGAVVTPVAMVPPPTVVGASQLASAGGKYKLVPMSEAEKAGMKKPTAKAKAPAVAKAAPAKKDCGGLPQSVAGQLVQKPCEPIYLGVPTPQVIAPAAAAPTAPPAAATAPAVPAAKKG